MFSLIFVEPETAGNVGAISRLMMNFEIKELILVNPKCDLKSDECKSRAKHSYKIIENARIVNNFDIAIKDFDIVIGTTGKQTMDYDATRTAYSPKEIKKQIQEIEGKKAIIIGRESTGLKNEELKKCSFLVKINTSKYYPVMNASHAAAVLLYELTSEEYSPVRKANKEEITALFNEFDKLVKEAKTIKNQQASSKMFKNIISRSTIAGREAHALMGIFKAISQKNNKN